MERTMAAIGSGIFFLLAPGIVAGVMPWWITRWRIHGEMQDWIALRAIGALLLIVSVPVLVRAFWQFASEGLGTPAPVAPTRNLVVGGLYRYVRNPMYLAVLGAIAGQSLLLAQPALLAYGAAILGAFVSFVHGYEEPTLARQFGAQYDEYRKAVPAWWPRRHPWTPRTGDQTTDRSFRQ